MTDTNKLTEARIEIARLEAEVEFQKRMKDACVDVISDQAKEATTMRDELDALRAEVERLRADLRCALRLLGEAWSEGAGDASWNRETFALMELHKKT